MAPDRSERAAAVYNLLRLRNLADPGRVTDGEAKTRWALADQLRIERTFDQQQK